MEKIRALRLILISGSIQLVPLTATPALAQRADDNAVADAEDAFGSNIGGEGLGVYDPFNVRGFSPIDAGNVRIEGLYIDRQAELTSRLVEGNRIRIGPSALGYTFPAPSGIADYRLRKPQENPLLSLAAKADTLGLTQFEADALLPLDGRHLGIAAGVGVYNNDYPFGGTARVLSTAILGVWRPGVATELTPFWSRIRIRDEEAEPVIIGDGQSLPRRIRRHKFLGQDWADFEVERTTYGMTGRSAFGGLALNAGLFHSADVTREGYTILLHATDDSVTPGARTMVADPYRSRASTSGELTVSRKFETGSITHAVQLSIRGREQRRRYGGSDRRAITPAPFGEASQVEKPIFNFSAQTDDRVRQWTSGLAYQGRIRNIGLINVGLQKTDYRKTVSKPSAVLPVSVAKPLLLTVSASADLTRNVALYGGFTQGLEESDVAPETAVNRDEAPPAIRTRQTDAGLRWQLNERLTLIAGGFEITKPYYGLDTGQLFRKLGTVTHRGIEASLTGTPQPEVTLVLGGVLLDARLSGEEISAGVVGRRPVGTASRKIVGSVDWRPGFLNRTSFDVSVEHSGPSYADVRNHVQISPRTIVDLGARYRFKLGSKPATLRVQATNVFDIFGWDSAGSNAFTYIAPRRVSIKLAADL